MLRWVSLSGGFHPGLEADRARVLPLGGSRPLRSPLGLLATSSLLTASSMSSFLFSGRGRSCSAPGGSLSGCSSLNWGTFGVAPSSRVFVIGHEPEGFSVPLPRPLVPPRVVLAQAGAGAVGAAAPPTAPPSRSSTDYVFLSLYRCASATAFFLRALRVASQSLTMASSIGGRADLRASAFRWHCGSNSLILETLVLVRAFSSPSTASRNSDNSFSASSKG